MSTEKLEKEYIYLVKDILEHEEFLKLKEVKHHGLNRFEHSLRVSNYSYKISKMLNLDSKSIARAALLHDFFLEDYKENTPKKKVITMFEHPYDAYHNSKKYFELNDTEKNIILSHMFPIGRDLPKKKESIVVDLVDDIVAIYERLNCIRKKLKLGL